VEEAVGEVQLVRRRVRRRKRGKSLFMLREVPFLFSKCAGEVCRKNLTKVGRN
jgi:hypothetical protein